MKELKAPKSGVKINILGLKLFCIKRTTEKWTKQSHESHFDSCKCSQKTKSIEKTGEYWYIGTKWP